LDTPKYAGQIRRKRIVEKQLAMGGIRTAAILNGLFAIEPSKEGKFLFAL
jgi:type IV secretory pathway TrbD component